jgi:hypothetical protein
MTPDESERPLMRLATVVGVVVLAAVGIPLVLGIVAAIIGAVTGG